MYFACKMEGFFKTQAGDSAITRCHHPFVTFGFFVSCKSEVRISPVITGDLLNQAQLSCLRNSLSAIADLQLFKNMTDVCLNGIL